MFECSRMLYHKPGPDLDIEGRDLKIEDANRIEEQGKNLAKHLASVARDLRIVLGAGREVRANLYDVNFYLDVKSEKEAQDWLRSRDVDPDCWSINEADWLDENEEDEEDIDDEE